MSMLGHGHHHVPFDEDDLDGVERRELIRRFNDLAAEHRRVLDENALMRRTVDHVMAEFAVDGSKRRRLWRRSQ